MVEGPGADSEEKHEPVSDIDTAVVDSLKALDLEQPIREAVVAIEGDDGTQLGRIEIASCLRQILPAGL
jgi:predicted transcriptional regulator